MALNEKESRVLSKIKKDPYISQKDLAKEVQLSRSSVANIISGLVQKGYLFGRAYVVNDTRPVVCIGAFNMDYYFNLLDEPISGISTDVRSRIRPGGMARNVAENLGRLNIPVSLLSIIGEDPNGKTMTDFSYPFMNLDGVEVFPEVASATYTEVHDKRGKMVIAMAELDAFTYMTPEWLSKHQETLEQAEVLVVDTNTPKKSIRFLIKLSEQKNIPIILICTAAPSLKNLPSSLKGVDFFIVRTDETAYYFNIEIKTNEDIQHAMHVWKKRGVHSLLLIENDETIIYGDHDDKTHFYSDKKDDKKDTQQKCQWGMAEALCAGVIYGKFVHTNLEKSIDYGCVNAFETVKHYHTINSDLTQHTLEKMLKRYQLKWNKKSM